MESQEKSQQSRQKRVDNIIIVEYNVCIEDESEVRKDGRKKRTGQKGEM